MLHRRVSILCVREAMRPQSLPGFRVYAKLTSRHQDIHNSIEISSSGLRMVVFWACQHFWDQCVQPFNPAKPEHCRIKTNYIICICLFIHTYVYMYICMYVCMYVCMRLHTLPVLYEKSLLSRGLNTLRACALWRQCEAMGQIAAAIRNES